MSLTGQYWYFALNYPEILEQYTNEELNHLQLKNGIIRTKGWWNDVWDTAESWWNTASDAITDWWNDGGREVVAADASGAAQGAMAGAVIAVSTASLGWGAIPTGAVAGGVYESAGEIITIWILK